VEQHAWLHCSRLVAVRLVVALGVNVAATQGSAAVVHFARGRGAVKLDCTSRMDKPLKVATQASTKVGVSAAVIHGTAGGS
jgi:hypothetical protein